MSDTAPVSFVRRLRLTPLCDLVRGRINGRLDWRGRVAAAGLPDAAASTIVVVVRRTRLWRLEKAAVAEELVGHFADGLAAGGDAETLVADFGDARTAAKLIRRAKRRGRPLLWQLCKWAVRGLGVLAVIYSYFLFLFLVRQPHVSVDYVARFNAPTLATPENERAWPLYRRAMVAFGREATRVRSRVPHPLDQPIAGTKDRRTILDATPADAEWPTLTKWLDAHADGLAVLREAAARPAYGFVLGPGGSQTDPELDLMSQKPDVPVTELLLPDLNHSREFAIILTADARYAAAKGDGARAVADVRAMIGIADQQAGRPFIISGLVRIGIYAMAIDHIERLLRDTPNALSDDQWVEMVHRVAAIGGDTASSLLDTAGERIAFHDLVQRMYSDDGHGDGRLTLHGLNVMPGADALLIAHDDRRAADLGVEAAVTSAAAVLGSRRDVLAEYDRLIDLMDKAFSRPLRDWPAGDSPAAEYDRRCGEIKKSPLLSARFLPLTVMLPAMERAGWAAERVLGRRDGVTVGIALELYRRRHGEYPATLDALTPTLLPRVPADRIDGKPVRYKLIDGRPMVYSVGVDRDDDAGRLPLDKDGQLQSWPAAQWPSGSTDQPRFLAAMQPVPPVMPDGDWPLYDARPTPPAE